MKNGILLILLSLLPTNSIAQRDNSEEMRKAIEYVEKEDYKNAYDIISKTAQEGNAYAMHLMGVLYYEGKGVPEDDAEAIKWFRKSAAKDNYLAQYAMGVLYDHGEGVPQDKIEAVKWYRKAAEQEYADAQNNLGWMYDIGEGVAQDKVEAVKWYRKAAEQGNADAQNNLGVKYDNGEGVAQDKIEAVEWYKKAAEQGHANAQCNLGWMYDMGKGVAQDKAEAFKWYQKAAEQGLTRAMFYIGVMYEIGEYVAQDKSEAVRWYKMAAEQGHVDAQYKIGVLYEKGKDVKQDKSEAVKWYKMAAEQGHVNAQYKLGVLYEQGEGVEKDKTQAVEWYKKAANQGHEEAQLELDGITQVGNNSNLKFDQWIRKYDVKENITNLATTNPDAFWKEILLTNERMIKLEKLLSKKKGAIFDAKRDIAKGLQLADPYYMSLIMDEYFNEKNRDELYQIMGVKQIFPQFSINFIEDLSPNAFSTPAGQVYVHAGLLLLENFSFDNLIGVLAHEATHYVFQHSLEEAYKIQKRNNRNEIFASIAGALMMGSAAYYGMNTDGGSQDMWNSVSTTVKDLFVYADFEANGTYHFKYSREQEIESDIVAYRFLEFIGVGGNYYIDALRKLDPQGEDTYTSAWSDHPAMQERIAFLEYVRHH